MPTARTCLVSFTDSENIRHAVEVSATTLYEAAVMAMAECHPIIKIEDQVHGSKASDDESITAILTRLDGQADGVLGLTIEAVGYRR